jgi:hypothetical protein
LRSGVAEVESFRITSYESRARLRQPEGESFSEFTPDWFLQSSFGVLLAVTFNSMETENTMKFAPYVTIAVLALLGSCAYLLTGCSSVKVTHVDDNDTSAGVHFYEPRPYLLVTRNASGTSGLMSQIIWLPDHSRRYKVEVTSRWGSVNGSVKLQNGWMLDTLGAQTDSKIPETIAAVGGLLAAIPKATGFAPPPAPALTEGLYLIEIDGRGEVSLKKTGQLHP